jgi:hypothetical protein
MAFLHIVKAHQLEYLLDISQRPSREVIFWASAFAYLGTQVG